ncbi:hypothetical protein ACFQOY_00455 [Enterococcus alcedinis]|uniref:Uncharacterized protein n=1 Tax=Enterococcus alcedinis TaxID=1274384 RepID=A0A917JCF8_9ENTE|nr:hypothetical protein [Enterococcus alcedinis]MBP2101041.1 hypothetical protein [Enterococcus alcedinis]GGI64660.1 hypothetical protein GCM10011482_03140 [Enterococcus alcedinis]
MMQLLLMLYVILFVLVVVGQFLLYKNSEKNIGFIWNTILGILFSYLIFTALPNNFIVERVISLIWGVLAIGALIIGNFAQKNKLISKILFSVAVIGGSIHLFFL